MGIFVGAANSSDRIPSIPAKILIIGGGGAAGEYGRGGSSGNDGGKGGRGEVRITTW